MGERLEFSGDQWERERKRGAPRAVVMFPDGADLPLFAGTPIPVVERPFVPEDRSMKQLALPGMPPIDYDYVLERDRELWRRRRKATVKPVPMSGDIFVAQSEVTAPSPDSQRQPMEATQPRGEGIPEQPVSRRKRAEQLHPLREALAPYLDFTALRRLAAQGEDLTQAFIAKGDIPAEVRAVLDALALMLRPVKRERVRSPADIAAVFMMEMAHLDQEQLRVACLNTRNNLQKVHLVYQGSLNTSLMRIGEVYKEPVRLNSAAIIVAHNHPSGDPDPSPEDVLVTRQIVDAGKLLDVECLDHLVIGQGRWVSMRERGLGFGK
jgi:DNA repair protein RadC